MLFNSFGFFLFFAVVLAVRYCPVSWQTRKVILLLLSYLFYAAWYPPHLLILWVSTVVDWFVAGRIARATSPRGKRWLLAVSLITNLGMLGTFKYAAFLVDNLDKGLAQAGIPFALPVPHLLLPIGISFYTFEALSYTIDVYRGKIRPSHSLLDFALFITFFPRMVAGPIMRASLFIPQCEVPRRTTADEFGEGLTLLVFGLFEKVVLADGVFAPVADAVYAYPVANLTEAWAGTLAFTFQIFFDFAGYSICAVGIAKCLGFHLPINFNSPYAAVNFSDFWQRWHISLSSWLRDYLYIPLGGNRAGKARTYFNLMVTMLLGGLWHGAAWRFVVWGGMHGLLLVLQRLWAERGRASRNSAWANVLLTFVPVCFTWVFFRAPDMGTALRICGEMIGLPIGDPPVLPRIATTLIFVLSACTLAFQWKFRDRTMEASLLAFHPGIRILILAVMLLLIVICQGENRAFIYFQF